MHPSNRTALFLLYGVVTGLYANHGFFIAIFPPFLAGQGIRVAVVGLLVGMLSVVALLTRGPAGLAYGVRSSLWVFITGSLLMAVPTSLYVFTHSVPVLMVLRAIQGAGFGVTTTTLLAHFMDYSSGEMSKVQAMGVFTAILSGGKMLGSVLGGISADWLGYTASFQLAALFTVLSGGLMYLHAGQAGLIGARRKGGERIHWRGFLRQDRLVLHAAFTGLVYNLIRAIFETFMPLRVVALGFSLSFVGVLQGMDNVLGLIVRAVTGWLTRRLNPSLVTQVGMVIYAGSVSLMGALRSGWAILANVAVMGFDRSVTGVTNMAEMAQGSEARSQTGLAAATYNTARDVGQLVGPFVGGVLGEWFGLVPMMIGLPLAVLAGYMLVARFLLRTPGGHEAVQQAD